MTLCQELQRVDSAELRRTINLVVSWQLLKTSPSMKDVFWASHKLLQVYRYWASLGLIKFDFTLLSIE